jgi:hypothetical protein
MSHQVVPIKIDVGVFLTLIVLTITTVAVSKVELGEYNFIVAMTIAVIEVPSWFSFSCMSNSPAPALRRCGILLDGNSAGLRPQRLLQPRLAPGWSMVVVSEEAICFFVVETYYCPDGAGADKIAPSRRFYRIAGTTGRSYP